MKRILNILAFTAVISGIVFTSCRDDSDYPEVETPGTIEIVSRELSFPAAASQGNIVVKASHPVTVTTDVDQPWMTAVVDGNEITVSVTENTSLYGRVSNLTLHSGTGKAYVSVIQSGLIFDIGGVLKINSNDEQKTFTYPVKANADVTVSSNVDWCAVEIVDGELVINFDANTTGHIRRGIINYNIGTISDQIEITQCDFDLDVAGEYKFNYQDSKGKVQSYDAVIARSGSNYTMSLGEDYVIPIVFDASSGSISVKAGAYVKDIVENNVTNYLYTIIAAGSSYTWGTSIGMTALLEYTAVSDGAYTTVGVFDNDGSWAGKNPTSICLDVYKSKTLNSSNRVKRHIEFKAPYLEKK